MFHFSCKCAFFCYACELISVAYVIYFQVCRDPRWGRCYESYSEDPKIVQSMTSLISGLQGEVPANDVGRPYVAGR